MVWMCYKNPIKSWCYRAFLCNLGGRCSATWPARFSKGTVWYSKKGTIISERKSLLPFEYQSRPTKQTRILACKLISWKRRPARVHFQLFFKTCSGSILTVSLCRILSFLRIVVIDLFFVYVRSTIRKSSRCRVLFYNMSQEISVPSLGNDQR